MSESQPEENGCQRTGPGSGHRQGNGDEKYQADSFVLFDDSSPSARPFEEPGQDTVEEGHSAEVPGG